MLPAELLRDGWIQLFDGETLFGWHATSNADWQVAEGEIRVGAGNPGFLTTATQFSDFELYVEFKADEQTNSGIFLRTPLYPSDPAKDCYELNIAPATNPFPTGSLVGRAKAEVTSFATEEAETNDQWHTFRAIVDRDTITIHLDNQQVLQYIDPQPKQRGYIALQLNQGPAAFRNIRLQPLGLKRMFKANSLEGWIPAGQSQFDVNEDGVLHVRSGSGQLESAEVYSDFVLQLECQVNGDGLNSGVFFRCIPRENMNGYESQIHNGFADGDRTKPIDCGTGGIFRRQNARRVVADDHAWFFKTIVGDGPHMAVWVNGYQVSSWTDDRPPDANPRRGSRLYAGTICIQGHDPTTDLLFRNMRIAEIRR
jgi:hypothetical protein